METKKEVLIPPSLTVRELAGILGLTPVETIKRLMSKGVVANINQVVDYETAALIAMELGAEPRPKTPVKSGGKVEVTEGNLKPRPPIVTILGHVDHGKTTLLDAIRKTNVAAKEAGAITQHIGAYQVDIDGKKITFLDTPGHEAFTAMRARGAQVTDIAVLVVAADEGVMPQTVEALNHARAARVPIVVAINKVDKPQADVQRTLKQISESGLIPEIWGGDTICVPVSAKTGQGISDLLENLLLVAELLELKADPDQPASGVVLESGVGRTKGQIATLLVQNGTLKVGDVLVVGGNWGKVKAMFNEWGKRLHNVPPSTPVVVLGIHGLPQAGDFYRVVGSEGEAKELAEEYRREREAAYQKRAPILSTILEEGVKEVSLVLKVDVQGSIEPIVSSIEKLSAEKLRPKIIHAAAGDISESDVLLALASKGFIIGFNTKITPGAKKLAQSEGVGIYLYDVIYKLTEGLENILKGMVEPSYIEVIDGHAQVLAIFPAGGGLKKVAGVKVLDGKVILNHGVRVYRNSQVIVDTKVKSLRRFKDLVTEVEAGLECGVGLEGFYLFEINDILEIYHKERIA